MYDEQTRLEYSDSELYTYPDVVVTRHLDDHMDAYYVCNPWMIIDVLSESTRSCDQITKQHYYWQISSLAHYILIHVDETKVEHHYKTESAWAYKVYTTGSISVGADIALDIAALYKAY